MKEIKMLAGLFAISAGLIIFPVSAQAFSLGDFFSSSAGFLNQVKEKVEYAFAFNDGQKVQVLNKQAEKRLEKAVEKAQTGDEESVKNLIEDYKDTKDKQGKIAEDMPDGDNVKNEIKNNILDDQKDFKEIIENVSSETAKQVIDSDREILSEIKNIVIEKGNDVDNEQFEKEVLHVWAEGTGPEEVVTGDINGEKNNVVVVGGLPEYAPGTEAGGESQLEIKGGVKNEVKVDIMGKEE